MCQEHVFRGPAGGADGDEACSRSRMVDDHQGVDALARLVQAASEKAYVSGSARPRKAIRRHVRVLVQPEGGIPLRRMARSMSCIGRTGEHALPTIPCVAHSQMSPNVATENISSSETTSLKTSAAP